MLLLIVNLTIIYIVNLQTNRFERPLYEKGNEHMWPGMRKYDLCAQNTALYIIKFISPSVQAI